MEEQKKVKAEVSRELFVTLHIKLNNRQYSYLIPSGVSYDEAYNVALEMAGLVKQMHEESMKQQEAQVQQEVQNAD